MMQGPYFIDLTHAQVVSSPGSVMNAITRRSLLLLLPLGFFLYACWRLSPHTLDDAYISMQYAKELLEGNGLVFTKGVVVEGFSNPLWVLLLALLGALQIPLVMAAKGVGVLCGVVTIALTAWLVQALHKEPTKAPKKGTKPKGASSFWLRDFGVASCVAASLVAIHPGTAYYAVAGLETSLFAMLVLLGVCLHVNDVQEHGQPSQAWCYLPLGFAAITRPEGPLFLVLMVLFRLSGWSSADVKAREDSAPLARLKAEAPLLGASFAIPLAWFLFRIVYFGKPLPNTFYAKPGTFWEYPTRAFGYISEFFLYHTGPASQTKNLLQLASILAAWVLSVCLLFGLVRALLPDKKRRFSLLLYVLCVSYIGFVFYTGGDWMTQHRFFQPIIPMLYALALVGLTGLSERWQRMVFGATLFACMLHAQHAGLFWQRLEANRMIDHAHRSQNNVKMAKWLDKHLPKGASIVTDEVGAVGYFTSLKVLDYWGLVTPSVTKILHKHRFNPYAAPRLTPKRAKVQAEIAKHLLAQKPDYILLDYQGSYPKSRPPIPQMINPLTMQQLYRAMKQDYSFVRAFSMMPAPPYKHFLLYKRKTRP